MIFQLEAVVMPVSSFGESAHCNGVELTEAISHANKLSFLRIANEICECSECY